MPHKLYPDVNPNPDFPAIEEAVLSYWQAEGLFKKSIESRPASSGGHSNEFIFYDGPPFANGLPHYGHLLTGFVKDLFARYETMKGKRVERRFGWDCHGLPAEMGSEKELGISGRQAITQYGIGKFNEHCRTSVMKYTHEWETYVNRQARWVDFKNDYKTMDTSFMESVLWAFKQIYDKGLVYEAYRVMPYSWAAETPLSNFETKLDNSYREKEDKAVTVAFELKEPPKGAPKADKYYVLAWTTTPWTLPSNLALAVNKDIKYGFVIVNNTAYICAKDKAVKALYDYVRQYDSNPSAEMDFDDNYTESLPTIIGADLIGLTYRPLFPYFADTQYIHFSSDDNEKTRASFIHSAFRILDGSSFVTDSDGTGIVHMAPGFGEDDQRVCEANGIDVVVPVDGQGKYTDAIFDVMLETGRLYARPFKAEDLDLLYGLHSSPEVGNTTVDGPQTREQTAADLKHFIEHQQTHGYSQWAIFDKNSGEFVGRAGLVLRALDETVPPQIEIRHALHTKFWGKGYATELATAVLQWGFSQTDAQHIVAGANPTAAASNRVLEKIGMVYVKNITYCGKECTYYTISKADIAAAPKSPLFLKGLNVIAETSGQRADEPYKPEQVKKYGLANLRIIQWLKEHGHLIKQEEIKHNYPHCWRTDQPLIYRAMPSWYVEVTKFRDRAVELNKQINWIPAHIRDGQMGHMLATAPDWSISRNRFWGTPIPVWRSKSGKVIVIGSIAELEERSGQKVTDLHRPYIDEITITEGGEEYKRVDDVFDCWFESGSMPFAQVHYPFENKEWFEHHFPADFITEYVGQTRGWFNTLIMLSTALFDKPPFKNCICHGVVLDAETGLKYSKRLKNYKDPLEVINQFGADALRWLMIASPVMRGQDIMVDPEGKFIRDVVRLAIKPIWNAYNFFCLYANADGVNASLISPSPLRGEGRDGGEPQAQNARIGHPHPNLPPQGGGNNVMDRYILAKCKTAVETIGKSLDAYDAPSATEAVTQFFEALNNWYIRRNKERFWKTEHDADKQAAYDTLYTVLTVMCRAAAPLLPLTLEEIYKGLTGEESVHLADFPDVAQWPADMKTLKDMERVRDICNTALGIRNKLNIRVRQPLKHMEIVGDGGVNDEILLIVLDEVNLKSYTASASESIESYATLKLSINSAVLGKRLPEKMKQILPASKKGEWKQVDGGVEIAGEKLLPGEYTLQLEPKPEYKDRAQPLSTNDALVILDTTITPELEAEGIARDLVRMIQQARKDADFNVSDRIRFHIDGPEAILQAALLHKHYIMEQTLAVEFSDTKPENAQSFGTTNAIDDQTVTISLVRAA